MKLSAINVDGFGIFRDLSLNGLDASELVVFHGRNEAGKSTVLGFIKAILFGFPHANSREPSYPPLAGGTLGGCIRLVTNNGQPLTVERRPGKKVAGSVIVTVSDGRTGTEELLRHSMGGVTFDVFKNIYAFSLSELQTIDTLRADNVKHIIYGASTGSTILTLPKAEKELNNHLDQLFKPRGSKQLINEQLAKYEKIRAELHQVRQGQGEFDEIKRNLRIVEEEIQVIQHRLAETNQGKIKLHAYARLWPEWMKIQESEKELALVPAVASFPADGIQKLDGERNALTAHQATLSELKNELKQHQTELRSLTVDNALIAQGEEINCLLERKKRYTESLEVLPSIVNEKDAIDVNIQEKLDSLGDDWTRNTILAVDKSIFTRENIRQFERAINSKAHEVATAEKLLLDKKSDVIRSTREVNETINLIEKIGVPVSDIELQLLQQLHNGRNEFARSIRDMERCEIQLHFESNNVAGSIRTIDPTWSEADINHFDTSVSAREKIERLARRLSETQADLRDVNTRTNVLETSLTKARQQHNLDVTKLQDIAQPSVSSDEALDKQKQLIRDLHKNFIERQHLEHEVRHIEERFRDKQEESKRLKGTAEGATVHIPKVVPWLVLLVAIFLLTLLLAFQKWEAAVATGVFIVLAMAFIIALRKHKHKKHQAAESARDHLDSIEKQVETIRKTLTRQQEQITSVDIKMEELANGCGLSIPISLDDLADQESRLEQDRRLLEQRLRLIDAKRKSEGEIKQLEKELNDTKNRAEKAAKDLRDTENDWKTHLQSINLNEELTPAAVKDMFSKVELVRQQIGTMNNLRNSIHEMEKTRDKYLAIVGKVPDLSGFIQRAPSDLLAKVDKFISRLQFQQKQREEYHQAKQVLKEKKKRLLDLENDHQRAKEVHNQLIIAKETVENEWRDWLKDRGLSSDLSPQTAIETLDHVSDCVEKMNRSKQLHTELASRKQDIQNYEQRASKLFNELNRHIPMPGGITVGIEELSRELEESKGNLREKIQVERQIKRDDARIKSVQLKVDQSSQRIRYLLEEGNSANDQEFSQHGHHFLERKRLSTELSQASKNISRISGETNLETLIATLKELSLDKIQARESELSMEEKDLGHQLEDLRNKRANLKLRISEMKSADDIARLRADEERVREEIRGLAFDWSRYAMAAFLMEKAKEKFEKEQQPRVIQDASVFFRTITDGGYHKLMAPIGKNTIEVITSRNERKKPEELSRGTVEQLYLSIRFGYIRNRSQNSESLPVIMDDVLVNFDPVRARNAAKAILELSKDHQILFFTCHPETVDIFRNVSKNVVVYKIENGQIAKQD